MGDFQTYAFPRHLVCVDGDAKFLAQKLKELAAFGETAA